VKIKTKLLAILLGTVLVTVVLITAMYFKTSRVTQEIADSEAAGTVADMTKLVDAYFTGLRNICLNAAPGVMTMFDADGRVDAARLDALMADLKDANDGRRLGLRHPAGL
jgi:hypothetical protein